MSDGPPKRRRLLPPRLNPDRLSVEVLEFLRHMESALGDLAGGESAPAGFDPRRFLVPGLPRVRPLLVLLSARAAGGAPGTIPPDLSDAEQMAAAAELLHVAIVLHDTTLGRQGGRRRRAARRLIGGAVGVLGGNHLTLRALELSRHSRAPELIGEALEALREISDGHALAQTLHERTPTAAEALQLAEGHNGAVFSFACRAGARLAGADRKVITALGRYGRHMGVAWHLAEDLAAVTVDTEEDARDLEDRAAEGWPSYAVGVACERDPSIADDWQRLSQDSNPELAVRLADRVKSTGAIAAARRRLVQETWAARKALAPLAPSRHRDALDQIVSELGS